MVAATAGMLNSAATHNAASNAMAHEFKAALKLAPKLLALGRLATGVVGVGTYFKDAGAGSDKPPTAPDKGVGQPVTPASRTKPKAADAAPPISGVKEYGPGHLPGSWNALNATTHIYSPPSAHKLKNQVCFDLAAQTTKILQNIPEGYEPLPTYSGARPTIRIVSSQTTARQIMSMRRDPLDYLATGNLVSRNNHQIDSLSWGYKISACQEKIGLPFHDLIHTSRFP